MRSFLGTVVLVGALVASLPACSGGGGGTSSPLPLGRPTPSATAAPTGSPSSSPTVAPTAEPTATATGAPTAKPTATPIATFIAAKGGAYIVDVGNGLVTSPTSLKDQLVPGGGTVGAFANADGTVSLLATNAAALAYAKIRVPLGTLKGLGVGTRAGAGFHVEGSGQYLVELEFTLPNTTVITAAYPAWITNAVDITAGTVLSANDSSYSLEQIAAGNVKTAAGQVTADSPVAVYVYTVGTGNFNVKLNSLSFF